MATRGSLQKLTAKRRALFLRELAECGNVTHAARTAGYTRQWVLELRRTDAEFAAEWDAALDEAAEVLEREAWRRAHDGVEEPVVSMGKLVRKDDGTPLTVTKYSDSLTQFLLKGMRPDKYRDNVKVTGSMEHSLVPAGEAKALADEMLDAVRDIPDARAAIAARLLARGD